MIRFPMILLSAILATAADAQPSEAEKKALEEYCREDVERLCKGVKTGGGAIAECLKEHEPEMSVGCLEALKKARGE